MVLLPACTPESGPTPTPTPTFTCTANVGACTPQQAEKEAQAAKDHAAAEFAVRAGNDEFYRLHTVPDAKITAELRKYLAGSELDGAERSLAALRTRGRIGKGVVKTVYARSETKFPTTTQSIEMCIDSTKFYTTDLAGRDPSEPVGYLKGKVTVELVDGSWKATDSSDPIKVKSCED